MSQKIVYKVGVRSEREFREIMSTLNIEEAESRFKELLAWYDGPLEIVLLKETWNLISTTPMQVSAQLATQKEG